MERVLKIFCGAEEREAALATGTPVATYDAFVLVRVPEERQAAVSARWPTEDITDQYRIRVEGHDVAGEPTPSRRRVAGAATVEAPQAGAQAKRLPKGPHHYLVQFVGPIKPEWLDEVRKAGGEVRGPFGDFTMVVRADEAERDAIAALPSVRWVGHLPWESRVAAGVDAAAAAPTSTHAGVPARRSGLEGVYTVQFFGSDDLRKGLPAVRKLGFRVLGTPKPGADVVNVSTEGTPKQRLARIARLSAVHGVKFIRPHALRRLRNDVARGFLGLPAVQGPPPAGLGLDGSSQIVAVADTGLDTGDPATLHEDFRGRVVGIVSYPITPEYAPDVLNPGADDGPADLDSGHGTHVCGSVLGDGTASVGVPGLGGPVLGVAPEARLFFQAVEQEMRWKDPADYHKYGRYVLAGIPSDLAVLFQRAHDAGARIHSDSWGGGDPGAYDAQCEQLDRFVWKHPEFCVVVAAGNDGKDADADGKIDLGSVSAPATAKNCVSVGASESVRAGYGSATYGAWWPDDYPAPPPKTDPMADSDADLAAFSSRGPTSDGRLKPDVVAPGTFILSTRSSRIAANNWGWAKHPATKRYLYMGGTSMATPLVAGCAALVREYLQKKAGIAKPTAALLKAALVASARRLGPTAGNALVDAHQGYGRVDLPRLLTPPPPVKAAFHEVTPGLDTGQSRTLSIPVGAGAPLRVVLCYSDYPGAALVNNLNLLVRDPAGKVYAGNQPPGSPPTPDSRSNVEVVEVAAPAAGTWSIQVVGSNVPHGPQPYALVILGA